MTTYVIARFYFYSMIIKNNNKIIIIITKININNCYNLLYMVFIYCVHNLLYII